MARRRYQKGQLVDDGDRWIGRWREDVLDPVTGEVKRVRKADVIASKKECPTKRLAQRKLDDRLREVNREDYRPTTGTTFAQFAQRWMDTVMMHHKPSTQRSERSIVQVHLVPFFGGMQIRDISAELLQAWVSDHTASPKTVRNIVMTLRTMLVAEKGSAKAWGYLQTDPVSGLLLPQAVKGNSYHFTVEETLAIINAAQGWKKTFFRILAETGMRPGELAGLRRQDVGVRTVKVSQSVWQRQVQTVKTTTAVRTFAISTALAEEIRRHIAESPENRFGLVFAAETGRPLSMDNFRHRTLNPILKRLGILEKIRAAGVRCGNYAFRHMNATLMDELGTPLKTRQMRLGHAQIETTLYHYTHQVDAEDVSAAEQIGALLNPPRGEAIQ